MKDENDQAEVANVAKQPTDSQSEPCSVNATVTWDEGYRSYPGRSARYAPNKRDAKTTHRNNPYRTIWLNLQKSVLLIVPIEPTERIGEGRAATADN